MIIVDWAKSDKQILPHQHEQMKHANRNTVEWDVLYNDSDEEVREHHDSE